jgi:quinolinate synthase
MADMADIGQVEECWRNGRRAGHQQIIPVTYMNSTAAIKSFTGEHGGAACTSSNTAAVMKWALRAAKSIVSAG